jgi:prepilin signal peptidase PulO-like enzyme (type II secretory pathway)
VILGWVGGDLAVALAAPVLALVPRPLMTEASDRPITWRDTARLGAAAALAGFAAEAGAVALGQTPWRWGLLAALLAAVTVVDAAYLVIPDLYVVALLALAIGWVGAPAAFAGAALGGGLLLLVRWAFLRFRKVEALGLGDVKLMVALGALAGAEEVLWIIAAASVIGIGVALLARRGKEGDLKLAPLGACAAAPALVVLAIGKLGA